VIEQIEQPVLSIRTTIAVQDMPTVLGQAYGEIMAQIQSQGKYPVGMPFVAYYNMDMQALDIEIGFPTARSLPGKGAVQPSKIPAGPVATCEYTGPYEEMATPYEALQAWIIEHGYEPTGISYEYYLNGPEDAPPSGNKTRIAFPLKA
ncbi:MAG TPA: GyrI-like domain-containing protein, partial [Anaerolineales bacterium]|nr:GyrI-like domain-containing protein [Anaerolineales bacterium]